jgi:MFS family permease
MTFPDSRRPDLIWIVAALGLTQIIGYGTLYYSFAIMAKDMSASFQVETASLYAIFSAGLLIGGFASPSLGRLMDRHGAPKLMALGSLLAGLGLGGLSLAPNLFVFGVLFCLLELVGVLVLYSAAFPTLAQFDGVNARRSITHLTLIAGFASTVFWPLSGWAVDAFGWRTTYAGFALLHLFVALPLHVWLTRRPASPPSTAAAAQPLTQSLSDRQKRIAFWCVAISFALSGALTSALNVHLVPVLQTMGLGAAAYYTSMLMGPAQVAIRLSDALFLRGVHPTTLALISCSALCLSVLLLTSGLPAQIAGASFALLFGAGQGLGTIVAGVLPLALFGASGFGARLGRLAAIRTLLSAGAPFVFAFSLQAIAAPATLSLVLAMGIAALAPLLFLRFALLGRAASLRPS